MISVSTIIPVHRYSSVVKKAITSAVNQDYENNRINIIVNSKEDQVVHRIKQDFEQTVNVVSIDNLGVSYARNEGIRISSSEYIAFLDSDDGLFLINPVHTLFLTHQKTRLICPLIIFIT